MLKSVENIIFNGVDLVEEFTDDTDGSYLIINEVSGRGIVGKVNNLIEVPYRDGAYPLGSHTPVRRIEVTLTLKGNSFEDLRKKIEKLNSIFDTGNAEVPIKFTDELDRVYYGKIDSTDYVLEVSHVSKYHLTIICSDPYKYGPEKPFSFETDYFNIRNEGTAEAEPIFELEVKEPITFAMLQNQFDEYNMIGRPYDENQEPVNRFDTVFHDNGSTLTGWTEVTPGSTIEGGITGGKMGIYGGYAFYAESFGSNPNGWVGPAVKKSLSRPIQDFRMTMDLETLNRQGNVGKIQIDLLDVNENVMASVQMVDATNGAWRNRAIITAGPYGTGHQILNHSPEGGGWNDFRGVLRVERIGNTFYAYVARVTDGRHHGRLNSQPFIDNFGHYLAEVAQVRVYIAKSKIYNPFPIYFHGGNVWEINDLSNNEIPYIAHPGDIITFDHTNNGQIYINGEPYEDTILGTDYFTLKKGDNNILAMPDNAFKTSGRYRERYL